MKSTSTKVQIFSDYKYGQINQSDLVDENLIKCTLKLKQSAREVLADEIMVFRTKIQEQEIEIARLKKTISELEASLSANSQIISSHEYIPKHDYEYNSALFSSPVGDNVIEILHELCTKKRDKNKFVINYKTDWYIVWKILRNFKIYTGTELDFVTLVQECVIPYIEDSRQNKLKVEINNFKSIESDSQIRTVAVVDWRKVAFKERERNELHPLHNEPVLERAINILTTLQRMLIRANITIQNADK